MAEQKVINVILSGGSGTRLWPLSRTDNPKQFLKIFNEKSLFQHTLIRNKKIASEFMIITNEAQFTEADKQAKESEFQLNKKIIEPVGRNTAPAIALAALSVDKDDILFITPSDHMTADEDKYEKCISRAVELANDNFLVTFGIKPSEAHTGYGYIEANGENVMSFREKPNSDEAEQFLKKGNFLWNSGMFCFKASVFIDELEKFNPEMLKTCRTALKSIKNGLVGLEEMKAIPSISIDYAVMEHSKIIKTIPSDFYWTDLGSFDAIINYFEQGNKVDNLQSLKTEKGNNFVFSNKKIVGADINDLIVVETEDSILLLPRNKSDLIKGVYNNIKDSNSELT